MGRAWRAGACAALLATLPRGVSGTTVVTGAAFTAVACKPKEHCIVECSGPSACEGAWLDPAPDVSAGYRLLLKCNGTESCKGFGEVDCSQAMPSGGCGIICKGTRACSGAALRCPSPPRDVVCGALCLGNNACQGATCSPSACPVLSSRWVPFSLPEPTAAPSGAPTPAPTASPRVPTAYPTDSPTSYPGLTGPGPTEAPAPPPGATPYPAAPKGTQFPTAPVGVTQFPKLLGPSVAPGDPPTAPPSALSAAAPSALPAAAPSAPPSGRPTAAPAAPPAAPPTGPPSGAPGTAPPSAPPQPGMTGAPSSAPTARPAAAPSAAPSLRPSATPSRPPTAPPSPRPSGRPATAAPSGHPAGPSAAPQLPSERPSEGPKPLPSAHPVRQTSAPRSPPPAPSAAPSAAAPSQAPAPPLSLPPVPLPTARPAAPTGQPLRSPPSAGPSSASPTGRPSRSPTGGPSAAPPTAAPSPPPPTLPPRAAPTAAPSASPSLFEDQRKANPAVVTSAGVAAGAAGLMSFTSAAASQGPKMARFFDYAACPSEGFSGLGWMANPTGAGATAHGDPHKRMLSENRGAMLANLGIIVCFIIFNALCGVVLKGVLRLTGRKRRMSQVFATVRFPSFSVFPALFMYQNVLQPVVTVAVYHPELGQKFLAAGVGFPLLGIPYEIWKMTSDDHFQAELLPNEQSMGRFWDFVWGQSSWASTDKRDTFERRYALMFQDYRSEFRRFLLADVLLVTVLSGLSAWDPQTVGQCTAQLVLIITAQAAFLVAVCTLKPYVARLDHWYTVVIYICQTVALILVLGAVHSGHLPLLSASAVFLLICTVLMVAKGVLDLYGFIRDRFGERCCAGLSPRRQRLKLSAIVTHADGGSLLEVRRLSSALPPGLTPLPTPAAGDAATDGASQESSPLDGRSLPRAGSSSTHPRQRDGASAPGRRRPALQRTLSRRSTRNLRRASTASIQDPQPAPDDFRDLREKGAAEQPRGSFGRGFRRSSLRAAEGGPATPADPELRVARQGSVSRRLIRTRSVTPAGSGAAWSPQLGSLGQQLQRSPATTSIERTTSVSFAGSVQRRARARTPVI
eukprot:TRINITY_DN10448_c0_g2_i2.p1 TRINITY_DN10448_c0_g2~~TRINITY_DN10448_c0_g2_i2.p1  ORF type:complete len:1096 (+),score=225.28 TRINITY_DN10448_c0_g2_i2:56-3289(+)